MQLHFEITSIGQPGQLVLIRLDAQAFAAFGLLLEQGFEFFDHLVHGLHHAAQFRSARQFRQAEKLSPGNGLRLFNHIIQRLELTTQQQSPQYRAHNTAEQQPRQTAQCTLPKLGEGKHGMADHLYPCSLLPAATDNGIAAGRFQADQLDEP